MKFFIDSILYSYSQIFFSNRRWFGAIAMLSTMAIPSVGFMALLGVIISNMIAYILKFDSEKIKSGFYGFNAILFGAAASYYFELNIFLVLIIPVFIVITFFISAVMEHYLAEAFNLPGLSSPFVISLFIFIIFLSNYDTIVPAHNIVEEITIFSAFPVLVKGYFLSLSLILFQPNIVSGIMLAVGLLFFSRVLFMFSITAYLLCLLFLQLILPHHYEQLSILYTFNAILASFALGGSLIIPSRKSFILVIVTTLMVVILTAFFVKVLSGSLLPVLVLPFNFIVLSTIYSLKFRKEQTDLVLLYFKPGSPEENLYYHQKRKLRFERFKFLFPELPVFGEWYISQGFNGEHTHKEDFRYAWDFVVVDEVNSQYSGTGSSLKDYYCYNLPVASPLDGEIVKVVDGIPDNEPGDVNIKQNWGNTVIIKSAYGLFTSISHLVADSIKVKTGDSIRKGDIIGNCGNSGRSPIPHIHLQFQANDKLGEKTFKFPFAHYFVKKDGAFFLNAFDYPKQEEIVTNIDIHKTIKNAFDLKLSEKMKYKFTLNGKESEEEWEIKVNILNELYIESSGGSSASFFLTNKVFYFTAFAGSRKTALYYFYLSAMQVPLCYQPNLYWSDVYSIDQLPGSSIRYISEFLLMIRNFLDAKGSFRFDEQPEDADDFVISNKIELKGNGIFSFYSVQMDTKVVINSDGAVHKFLVNQDGKEIFTAERIYDEEVI